MPAFIPLIAAVVAAGTTIYATESAKGNKPAPAAPQNLGKEKNPMEMPDIFKSGGGGAAALLGGDKERPRLSQSLGNQAPPQDFGSQQKTTQLDEDLRRQQIASLLGMNR